jgi:hypothetical protein
MKKEILILKKNLPKKIKRIEIKFDKKNSRIIKLYIKNK